MITTLENAMLTFMKKLSKEQIEKRNRIKQFLLKTLHIVSYILSALFIIVCIVVGVQSCNGKNKQPKIVSDKNFNGLNGLAVQPIDNFAYSYSSKYSGTSTNIDFDVQNALLTSISNYTIYQQFQSDFEVPKSYSLPNVYAYDVSLNQFVHVYNLYIVYNTFYDGHNGYYLRIKQIYFSSFGFCEKTLINQDGSAYNSRTYNFDSYWATNRYNKFYCSDDSLSSNPFFSLFFNEAVVDGQPFNMNYDLNYYWWVGNQSQDKFDDIVDIVYNSNFLNNTTYDVTINMPYFVSNNYLFNQIRLRYYDLYYDGGNLPLYWVVNGQPSNVYKEHGFGYFAEMRYINTINNNQVVVFARDMVTMTDSQNYIHTYNTNTCSWSEESWRSIKMLQPLDPKSDDGVKFYSLNSYSYITNYTGGIMDIFTLMKNTFGAIIPVLNIAVLPNFTIAMLLTIPLAVTAIIVIIRLVKK